MTFQEMPIDAFVQALGSSAPVPGGGGASALAGAVGTALGTMVGSLTVGKKKYAAYEAELQEAMREAKALEGSLLHLCEKDAEAFEPLSKAYGLPRSTEEEKKQREIIMEAALETAAAVPLEIMEAATKALELTEIFAEKGSVLAISDAGVSAALLSASLRGASLNVYVNTRLMKNREKAAELEGRADDLLQAYIPRADKVFEAVHSRLR